MRAPGARVAAEPLPGHSSPRKQRFNLEVPIVNLQNYELRIRGLKESPGKIKADTLIHALGALIKTAERTTRLLATGSGTGRGSRPRWLAAATNFTITGFRPGSTIVEVEASPLRETAAQAFGQTDFWAVEVSLDETALDLAARAIAEAQSERAAGDHFDSSVLEAIGSFASAVREPDVLYELTSQNREQEKFKLDIQSCNAIKARLKRQPQPRACIVSGRLDEIRHGNGRFSLLVNDHTRLFGRIGPASLEIESLRPLWGTQTTVEGIVHFKADGQSRLIEARRISRRLDGDRVFEEAPTAQVREPRELFPGGNRKTRGFNPAELAGAWPGDEPLEELLAQTD